MFGVILSLSLHLFYNFTLQIFNSFCGADETVAAYRGSPWKRFMDVRRCLVSCLASLLLVFGQDVQPPQAAVFNLLYNHVPKKRVL